MFFPICIKDDDETESTETSILKSHLVHEVPVLASPDLLSEVSEMKQDLIKMTAILTTDSSEKPGSIKVKDLAKAADEEPGEPFEIVERVKEDLEKVNEILRSGSCPKEEPVLQRSSSGRELVEEEWVILSDEEIEEAKQNAPSEVTEPPCTEVRIGKAKIEKETKDMTGMIDYLSEDLKAFVSLNEVHPKTFEEDIVGEKFEAVVLSRGSETGEGDKEKQRQHKPTLEIKKPVRKKLKDKQKAKDEEGQGKEHSGLTKFSSEESLDEETGLAPAEPAKATAVSPVIEETPIGSIKDKVKALQKRVEDEQKVRSKLPIRVPGKEGTTEKPVTKPSQAKKIIYKTRAPVAPPASKTPASPPTSKTPASPSSSKTPATPSPSKLSSPSSKKPAVSPTTKKPAVSPTTKKPPISPTSKKPPVSPTTKKPPVSPTAKKPPVSPSSKTERLEETMSVRELMKAFQSGQDPSKHKAGLFEHKSIKQKQQGTDKETAKKGTTQAESEKKQAVTHREIHKKDSPKSKRGQEPQAETGLQLKKEAKDITQKKDFATQQVKQQTNKTTEKISPVAADETSKEVALTFDDQGDTELQISPDRKTSTDFSDVIKEELEDNDKYQQFRHISITEEGELHLDQVLTSPFNVTFPSEYVKDGFLPTLSLQSGALDGSSESLKHEGIADSPVGSLLDGTPQISSEESYKHEGLAETPETSPESLSFSPKKAEIADQMEEAELASAVQRTAETHSPKGLSPTESEKTVAEQDLKAITEISESHPYHLPEEQIIASKEEIGKHVDSSSTSVSKDAFRNELSVAADQEHSTELSEIHTPSLEKDEGASVEHHAISRGLELSLPSHDSEGLSPVADESIAISHKDSLEASPVLEDNSSRKTPDSLEPSPTKESPCRDSLESSPVEQKTKTGILPGHNPIQTALAKAENFPELTPVRSRLLRDPDGSAEDDSLEQTSLMESSGKSPLSPETPSSEEISYEITPKITDSQVLANISKSAVIPEVVEEPEDDPEGEPKKRFTPEEEMFKMVTKVKMFDELEQEAKQKRDYKKDSKQDDAVSASDLEAAPENEIVPSSTAEDYCMATIVASAVDARKSSSSSESEPELTKLKKEADSGLLMEPLIRVQAPSPNLSNMDSSSSPEETGFQPIESKQHTFSTEEDNTESDKPTEETKMSGDTSLASDASIIAQASESKCYSTDESDTVSPNGPVMPPEESFYHSVGDGAQKEAELYEASVTSHLQDVSEKDSAATEGVPHRDLITSGTTEGSCQPGTSHCCVSQLGELATVVSPVHSPLGSDMAGIEKHFELAQRDCCSPEHSTEYSFLVTQKGECEGNVEYDAESSALPITSPYENVPSQHFFTGTEISTGIDFRTTTDQSSTGDHSGEVVTSLTEEIAITKSLYRAESSGSGDQTSEDIYMEIESKQVDIFQKIPSPMSTASDLESLDEAALQDIREEAEKIISEVIITRTDVDSDKWSQIREDDDAFEARVKEEEQKIFGLMVDRRSQGTTPDTTPARTPTEEGTPTSEQNPFLFQEGKLFEMTRSGAIDMTKRNYSDETLQFFQMGEHSQEEVSLSEEMKEAEGLESPQQDQTSVHSASSDLDKAEMLTKDSLLSVSEDEASGLHSTKGDAKSRIPIKMGVSASSKSPKKETAASDIDTNSTVDTVDMLDSSQVPCPVSPEQTVIDVQLNFSTVTRSVYAEQDDDSPDSSPEEQKSVIEIPTAIVESVPSSESKSKIPVRTGPSTPHSLHQSEPISLLSDGLAENLEESQDDPSTPKSKIPVKAVFQRVEQECMYTETSVWKPESSKALDTAYTLPMKQDIRSKSESDSSASIDPKAKRSVKARSYAEAEAETREREGDTKLELESDELTTARPKIFSSRLPVKSRSTSSSHGAVSPSRESKEHFFDLYKNSIEFFEEISDEASKLVDRLTQSEKEQELVSDDESSSALEVSVIENVPSIETQQSVAEDIFDTRPIWDESIETLIERIPDENVPDHVEGI